MLLIVGFGITLMLGPRSLRASPASIFYSMDGLQPSAREAATLFCSLSYSFPCLYQGKGTLIMMLSSQMSLLAPQLGIDISTSDHGGST